MTIPSPPPARRLDAVLSPVIPEVGRLLRRRPDALSLAQGMVRWGPPAAVREVVARAMADGPVADGVADPPLDRYGAVEGDPALLEAVRREYLDHRGLDLEGSDLLVTAGSNMAFNALAQVLLDPGDEVILPLPYYFNHVMAIQLAGGVPVPVNAGLVPDPERLAAAITARTRAIVTVSPGNPTGLVVPPAVLTAINRLCVDRGLFHISDEAYAEFVHGAVPHRSPGAAPGSGTHTISLHSLSKAYGMAGWRVGYAAVPRQLAAGLAKVQDTVLICPPRLVQRAAVAALAAGPAWCRPRVEALGARRRELLEAVAHHRRRGLDWELLAEPDGAFYALLGFATPLAGRPAIERLLLGHGVAVLPAESFGWRPAPGRAVVRLSYGMLDRPSLAEALERLAAGAAALAAG